MEELTGIQVLKSMEENDIRQVEVRRCSICRYMMKYIRNDDKLYFDSGRDCVSYTNIQERSFQQAADWVNMQSNEDVKKELANKFGIEL